jgi:hypothetical protein
VVVRVLRLTQINSGTGSHCRVPETGSFLYGPRRVSILSSWQTPQLSTSWKTPVCHMGLLGYQTRHISMACLTESSATMSAIIILTIAALAVVSLKYLHSVKIKRHRLPLPPGPKPWPIIGNALDIPTSTPWIAYAKWSEVYGTFFSHFPCYTFSSFI